MDSTGGGRTNLSTGGGAGSDSDGSGSVGSGSSGGSNGSGQAAIGTRIDGGTAGVVRQGRQSVFKSSTAPKGSATDATRAGAVGATEDLWTSAPGGANLTTAADLSSDGGLSTAMIAGIVILGLGLIGITGGLLAAEARRRRAEGTAGPKR